MGSRATIATVYLLQDATVVAAGAAVDSVADYKTYQAKGTTSAGVGSATIQIEGSNDGLSWDNIGTITLTLGTTSTSGSFTSNDRYRQVRANVTAISGTNADVTAYMAY